MVAKKIKKLTKSEPQESPLTESNLVLIGPPEAEALLLMKDIRQSIQHLEVSVVELLKMVQEAQASDLPAEPMAPFFGEASSSTLPDPFSRPTKKFGE